MTQCTSNSNTKLIHSFDHKGMWIATTIYCEFLILAIVSPFHTLLLVIEMSLETFPIRTLCMELNFLYCFKMLDHLYFVWKYCSWSQIDFYSSNSHWKCNQVSRPKTVRYKCCHYERIILNLSYNDLDGR